jgi:hypothetical protein
MVVAPPLAIVNEVADENATIRNPGFGGDFFKRIGPSAGSAEAAGLQSIPQPDSAWQLGQ